MKKRLLLLLSIILFSTVTLFANEDYRYEDSKRIKKNYSCSQDVLFALNNKYGNVSIDLWDKNEIEINVDITVKASNERDVNRILDMISVAFESSRSKVSATTLIANNMNNNNANFSISYHILLPRKANMELYNKYGNVFVSQCNGHFMSDIKYGNLDISRLNSVDVNMISKYGNIKILNSDGGYAKINIGYGKVFVDSFKSMDITSRYSEFKAENIENINVNSKYDKYEITNCSTINISEGGYTKFNIDRLKVSFTADDGVIRYGSVKLGGISSMLKQIRFNCGYTDVSLTFSEKADYNFDLFTSYGGIVASNSSVMKFNLTFIKDGNTSVAYSKMSGDKNIIAIKNKYNDIKLY